MRKVNKRSINLSNRKINKQDETKLIKLSYYMKALYNILGIKFLKKIMISFYLPIFFKIFNHLEIIQL